MRAKTLPIAGAFAAAVCLLSAGAASASPIYNFSVATANQNGVEFDASSGAPGFNSAGAIDATFSYSGPLSFANTASQNSSSTGDLNSNFFNAADIGNYSGSGTLASPANANFNTEASFLASSGSAGGFQYGSFYTIDLGTLTAGTILTITHDDGASVYQGGTRIGSTTSGPTTAVTEQVTLAAGGDTTLYYGRENGTPSVLEVAVPEPGSLALFGTALLGFGLLWWRRRQA